jgi:hypothetical protein
MSKTTKEILIVESEAVGCYKANHVSGDINEKALLQFIDELEQLTIPVVVGQSEQLPQDKFCKVCNLPTDGKKCYSKRCLFSGNCLQRLVYATLRN